MQIKELTNDEIESVSGGVIHIPIGVAVGIVVVAGAAGWELGKAIKNKFG